MKQKLTYVALVVNVVVIGYVTFALNNQEERIVNTERAIMEAGQVLIQSRIVQKNPEGAIVINEVITKADVQSRGVLELPNGI